MDKYLIMTDLDGTLLNKKSKLTKKNIRYLRFLEKKGHYVILSTGRPYQGCINFYNQIGLTSPLVCDNGGSIHFPNDHSKDIFTTIPLDLFIDFVKEIRFYIFSAMSSHFDIVYYYNKPYVPHYIQHNSIPRPIVEGFLDEIVKKPPINPTFFIKEADFDKVLNVLKKEKYSSIIEYRFWKSGNNTFSLELFNKEATKGHTLTKLKNLLNINFENDLVFGDQMNDVEMLQTANNSVAMKNGKELLKKISKYTTYKTNDRNGVIHFMKKFFKNIK